MRAFLVESHMLANTAIVVAEPSPSFKWTNTEIEILLPEGFWAGKNIGDEPTIVAPNGTMITAFHVDDPSSGKIMAQYEDNGKAIFVELEFSRIRVL